MKSHEKWFLFAVICVALLWAGCALFGCGPQQRADGAPESNTISIIVKNDTDAPFYGVIGAGALSKTLVLKPREQKGFWAYKSMVPDTIVLVVMDKEPAPAKRK